MFAVRYILAEVFEVRRAEALSRMNAIFERTRDQGRMRTPSEKAEFDDLRDEVREIDQRLSVLFDVYTRGGKVLQRLRDIENRRESFDKVVERFHNPRIRETMVPGILQAIEGVMATLPPSTSGPELITPPS